ncbi:MAG: response regulator [Candidatus Omnitrophota bacterium]
MKTILIVDDEKDIRELLQKKLEKEGYGTMVFENASEALNMCRVRRPDLILLDIVMPDMNGYEFARKLYADKDTQGIPIIFQTGKDLQPQAIENRVHEIGAFDFITKPYTVEELLAQIKEALG